MFYIWQHSTNEIMSSINIFIRWKYRHFNQACFHLWHCRELHLFFLALVSFAIWISAYHKPHYFSSGFFTYISIRFTLLYAKHTDISIEWLQFSLNANTCRFSCISRNLDIFFCTIYKGKQEKCQDFQSHDENKTCRKST